MGRMRMRKKVNRPSRYSSASKLKTPHPENAAVKIRILRYMSCFKVSKQNPSKYKKTTNTEPICRKCFKLLGA